MTIRVALGREPQNTTVHFSVAKKVRKNTLGFDISETAQKDFVRSLRQIEIDDGWLIGDYPE
jgi:hypothetical protein